METATIYEVRREPHFTGRAKKNKFIEVEIEGGYRYTFSQVLLPAPAFTDTTMVWKDYFTQDPMHWDGTTIGDSDMSIHEWLEEQGYEVIWDTPIDNTNNND